MTLEILFSKMLFKLAVLVIALNTELVTSTNQPVWLEDITHNARARNLDLGLPDNLQFKLKRSGHQDLTLNLVENKRLNQNAPVYEVHTEHGLQKLVKKETAPITDAKFYHDKKNAGSFMVECSKRKLAACRRFLSGSLKIDNAVYEINPAPEKFVSRSLAANKLSPHLLSRVIDRSERNGFVDKELQDRLTNALRRFLFKSELDAFAETIHLHRDKRQSPNTYALEILVAVDPSIWNRYYTTAVATATMTKEEANELFIRKRFSHIINGVSLRYESIDDAALNIYVTMTGIIIYKTIGPNNPLPNDQTVETVDGRQVADGTFYLNNLHKWLADIPGKPDNDHAMVFTQFDLYDGSETRDYNTAGISWLRSVCTTYRVSIQENDDYYVTTSVAAHELGHNLGSHHDGYTNDPDAAACTDSDKFIMAPRMTIFSTSDQYTVNPWRFSTCSIVQFKKYIQLLDTNNMNCLLDAGNATEEYKEHATKQPGELYSPTEQCQLIYGDQYVLGCGQTDTNPAICKHMYCGPMAGESCNIIPAAQGTPCDQPALNKWCHEGQCVPRVTAETTSAPATSAAPQTTNAPQTTAAPTTTTAPPQTTAAPVTTTTTAAATTEDCFDYGYIGWTCPAVDNYYRTYYKELPQTWCQYDDHSYQCCQYCRANAHITTTFPPMPADCLNKGWSSWSCEKVSTYFKDTYGYDPSYWCGDPNWQDACCVTCYENGVYYKK